MKRDFEKYYPLPWSVKCRQACYDMDFREEFVMLDMNAVEGQDGKRPPSLIDFTARGSYDHLNGRDPILEARKDALKYLVQCANLMPECIEVLKPLLEVCKDACALCSAESDVDATKCNCSIRRTIQQAEELLVKVEGGAEDA